MRTSVSLALMLMLTIPSLAQAQEKNLLASAKLAAAELAQQQQQVDLGSTRRSTGRVALGLAIAGAGAAMLLIDPKQPTQPAQPTAVSEDQVIDQAAGFLAGLSLTDIFTIRDAVGAVILRCEPFCPGDVDAAILGSFVAGAATGVVATITAADAAGWRLYSGPIQPFVPFKERSPALKYGGAALAVTGALVAGLWSQVPVMNALAVAPTLGGLRVSTSVGF